MDSTGEEIKKILKAKLKASHIDIVDDSAKHAGHAQAKQSGGGHFSVTVVANVFTDKPLAARHRMVYEALKDLMDKKIHALALKTLTPEELP